MSDSLEIQPVTKPIRGAIRPPGSKSLTNRALIVAALAEGTSRLSGLLDSRDTRVMANGLRQMGIELQFDPICGTAVVRGCAGSPPAWSAAIRIENSGTSIRFLTAFCTLATGEFHLDGNERMRQRPIVDLVDALNTLGADVCCDEQSPGPPVTVRGNGLSGGTAKIAGTTSSQYLSALLMAAPCARSPVELQVEGDLVSQPYVAMTIGVMREFDVTIDVVTPECFRIAKQTYRSCDFAVEPDASAASYFFAAAAITGGEVTVLGLSRRSLQGDVRFIDVLEQMGCTVFWGDDRVTVSGGELQGIEVDMNDISDTAQTLAAVAVFANGPTRITNIAHVRHKETDRIAAVAAELQKLGITVDEFPDGLTVHPGQPQPGVVKTYDDHRMAMSFALIGLRTPGIQIADPGCTEKTYPRFFEDLKELRGGESA